MPEAKRMWYEPWTMCPTKKRSLTKLGTLKTEWDPCCFSAPQRAQREGTNLHPPASLLPAAPPPSFLPMSLTSKCSLLAKSLFQRLLYSFNMQRQNVHCVLGPGLRNKNLQTSGVLPEAAHRQSALESCSSYSAVISIRT